VGVIVIAGLAGVAVSHPGQASGDVVLVAGGAKEHARDRL